MDNVTGGGETVMIDGRARHVSGYLRDFLFPPERLNAPVSMLSGGERNRLLLAKLFARPSNLLVMDEPTNDLDAETLELLEEMVADYAGTLLLVSHDREFLDNVVTSTLVFEGQGRIGEYVGGYSDWMRQRRAAAPPAPRAGDGRPRVGQRPAAARRSGRSLASARTRSSASSTRCRERIQALEIEQAELQGALARSAVLSAKSGRGQCRLGAIAVARRGTRSRVRALGCLESFDRA